MAKCRKKKKHFSLLDALLTAVDALCEGVAALFALLGRALLALLRGLARGLFAGLRLLARALVWPFARFARRLGRKNRRARECLRLTGPEFEAYFALVLADNGFRDVEVTKGSGDQGVDILAVRNGKSYAIQCKNYDGAVGNFAVQEAFAGAEYYGCEVAAVVCPGAFTRAAKELAAETGVLLWDGERLSHMMRVSGRRPRHMREMRENP